jgi:hypothetical protein
LASRRPNHHIRDRVSEKRFFNEHQTKAHPGDSMKMIKRAFCVSFILAIAVLTSCSVSSAQAPGPQGNWVYLGSAHVDGGADHDKIRCHGHDTYRAIQLHVIGGAVRFDHVVIVYGNHQSQQLWVRNLIPDGGRTRSIDLPGVRRDIDYVELWYEKANWSTHPEVQLFGLQ